MASIISAGTTSGTALNFSGDTTGVLQLASNGTTTALSISTAQVVTLTNALPVTSGGTGVTTSTGTGANVLATSPTITTPNLGTPSTLVLTNATGLPAAQLTGTQTIPRGTLPTGSVLQVVQSFKTDTYSQTSQTYTVITGLTATITPTSNTSKILFMAQIGCSSLVNSDSWAFAVGRGGSVVTASIGDAASNRPRATVVTQVADFAPSNQNFQNTIPIMFLDSPATTSSTTYSVMGRTANGGTLYINRTNSDRDTSGYDARWTSSITIMEISA